MTDIQQNTLTKLTFYINRRNVLIVYCTFMLILLYFIQRGVMQIMAVSFFTLVVLFFSINFYAILSKYLTARSISTKFWITLLLYLLAAAAVSTAIILLYNLIAKTFNNYGRNFQDYYNVVPYLWSMLLCNIALCLSIIFWENKWVKQFIDPIRYPAMVLIMISIIVSLLFMENVEQAIYAHVPEMLALIFAEILGIYQSNTSNYMNKVAVSNAGYYMRFSSYGVALFFAFMHLVDL